MKKKICNFIILILIIALVIVVGMIIVRYGKNYFNEKELSKTLNTIEDELKNKSLNKLLDVEYKGYKIEGIIEIPKINIKYPIINETNEETMKISVTKFSGPQANEIGNYCIAGHNNRDGTMFGKTKYLEKGDTIRLTNLENKTIEYQIFEIYSIDPNDVTCTNSINPTTREITLITCTNGHKNRLITKARKII